jgi:hypothetical protein
MPLTVNGRQNSRVTEMLLPNQSRFKFGRNFDEILVFDPLAVAHQDDVLPRARPRGGRGLLVLGCKRERKKGLQFK